MMLDFGGIAIWKQRSSLHESLPLPSTQQRFHAVLTLSYLLVPAKYELGII